MGAIEPVIARIESLIATLPAEPDTTEGLMREHLMEARSCLFGSMPSEYRLTLRLAEAILPQISNKEAKSRIAAFLESQQGISDDLRKAH